MQTSKEASTIRGAGVVLCVLLALAATFAAYGGSLDNGWARDDAAHFTRAERFTASPVELVGHFGEGFWEGYEAAGLYRPLTIATIHANQLAAGGGVELRRGGLRAGNLVLHALAAAALGLVALRFGAGRVAATLALLCAALHPLLSEVPLEVVSRSESLAALFSLLALLAASRASATGWAVAGLAWFLALLSKESAAGALAPLALLAALQRRERGALAAGESWVPAAACGVALALWLVLRRVVLGAFFGLAAAAIPELDNPLVTAGLAARALTAVAVLGRYVRLFVWPDALSPDYSLNAVPAVESPLDGHFLLGLATLVLGGLALVRAVARRRDGEAVGLALAGATWLPTSNLLLPVGTLMAERLTYAPVLGILLAGACALGRWLPTARRATWAVVAAGALIALALGWRAARRAEDWQSRETLYLAALEVVPDSARVQASVGFHRVAEGRYASARPLLERALELHPGYAKAHAGLARCLVEVGGEAEREAAVEHWRLATDDPSVDPAELYNYARAVLEIRPQRALLEDLVRKLEAALERDPARRGLLAPALREVRARLGA